MKAVLIKARENLKAGDQVEVTSEEFAVLSDTGYAVTASEWESRQENERIKAAQKERNRQTVKAAVDRAKGRNAIPPKDEEVLTTSLGQLDKGADPEFIVKFIDGLTGKQDDLSTRTITGSAEGAVQSRVAITEESLENVSRAVVTAMEPQNALCRANNWGEAMRLSREAGTLMDQKHMKIVRAGGDFLLRDTIRAATFSDPNSQVGSLAGDLILMRNLGYLVNKLAWMKKLTTDLSGEPAKFGQAILTRYITPPAVLTWCPGIGFTRDATAISTAGTGTTQSGAATPTATAVATTPTNYVVTKSAPSTTDVSVTMNMFKATEIEFPVSTLAGTARALFSEQYSAQTYSLAEEINKYVLAKIFAATWSGTITAFPKALANWNLSSLIDLKAALSVSKVPDVGRFVLLHTFYHDKILQDTNLLTAKAIMAVIKGDASAFETADVPALFGIKPLESQLSSANSGTLTTWSDPANLGTTNQVGFAGNMSSMLFVSRPPQDWTTTITQLGIPPTASIRLVTEPDSGLTVMSFNYVDNGKMAINQRVCLMYGAAQGDPRVGIVVTPA